MGGGVWKLHPLRWLGGLCWSHSGSREELQEEVSRLRYIRKGEQEIGRVLFDALQEETLGPGGTDFQGP